MDPIVIASTIQRLKVQNWFQHDLRIQYVAQYTHWTAEWRRLSQCVNMGMHYWVLCQGLMLVILLFDNILKRFVNNLVYVALCERSTLNSSTLVLCTKMRSMMKLNKCNISGLCAIEQKKTTSYADIHSQWSSMWTVDEYESSKANMTTSQ